MMISKTKYNNQEEQQEALDEEYQTEGFTILIPNCALGLSGQYTNTKINEALKYILVD